VTGRDPSRTHVLLEAIRAAGVTTTVWPLAHEPTLDDAREVARVSRDGEVELVAGVGGGSVIDLAKAAAALATSGGDPLDYLEVIGRGRPLGERPLPCIAVPTTAGAGAEVTRNAVLASQRDAVKASLRSAFMSPRLAVVDPELTLSLPADVTAATGMDALAQLLEPYVSSRANPITDPLCLDGLGRVARSLRRAWTNGADLEARTDMALAALFGGLALANAGLGAVHGFASAIGGRFDAPHGAVCAALLPGVVRANAAALVTRAPESQAAVRYAVAARAVTGDSRASVERLVEWLQQLRSDLRIPVLGAYGVGERDAEGLVAAAARASSMKANPIALEPHEMHEVLASAC
jgi:alcohol dehydrogenase class IV